MVERFLEQTTFASQEDFIKNLKIKVPENFNFGYDVVDAWAAEEPDKKALLWTNDKGESRQFIYVNTDNPENPIIRLTILADIQEKY